MAEALDDAMPEEIREAANRVLQLACDADCALVTAESCTGGLLAALLTDVEGKSHVFECGIVAYSDEAKSRLLGVDRGQIERCGAVSREVALAMASGALGRSEAAIAVSITGFAGPPGEDEDGEEGLVHFGCARSNGETMHREERFGPAGRDGVRLASLEVALAMFEDALKDHRIN